MRLKKLYRSLFSNHSISKLYFVHRIDENIGDLLSAPYRYYEFAKHHIIDICHLEQINKIPYGSHIIVGGGGLMMPYFEPYRKALLARRPAKLVWWGVGERHIQDLTTAYLSEHQAKYSIQSGLFAANDLVGFRQTSAYYPFLPCVSCKAIEAYRLSHAHATHQHDVVFFEHRDVPLPQDGNYPRRNNLHNNASAVFSYLDSAPVVVTNSYHGMYWSLLLGKQVIVVPFSSGMYHHPWPVHHATAETLPEVIDKVRNLSLPSQNAILADCIARNNDFYKQVLHYLAS